MDYKIRFATPDELADLYLSIERMIMKLAYEMYGKCNGNVEFDELVSVGNVAFMKAVHNFDTTRGCKFITSFTLIAKRAMQDLVKCSVRRAGHEVYEPAENTHQENGGIQKAFYEQRVHTAVMLERGNRTESDALEEDLAKQQLYQLLDSIADNYMTPRARDVYYLHYRNEMNYSLVEVGGMLGLQKFQLTAAKREIISVLQNHLLEYDWDELRSDYLAGIFSG